MRVADDYYMRELRGKQVFPIRKIHGCGIVIVQVVDWERGNGKRRDEWAFSFQELVDG